VSNQNSNVKDDPNFGIRYLLNGDNVNLMKENKFIHLDHI